jgi:hypothetical protein
MLFFLLYNFILFLIITLQFTQGKFLNLQTTVSLPARHCLELASSASSNGHFVEAIELLNAARLKVLELGDETVSIQAIQDAWKWIKNMSMVIKYDFLHNPKIHKSSILLFLKKQGQTWNIDDVSSSSEHTDEMTARKLRLKRTHDSKKFKFSYENRIDNFKALCRGDRPPTKLSKLSKTDNNSSPALFCYIHTANAFALSGQRIEIHSFDPEIIQIHDLFSDTDIHDITTGPTVNSHMMQAMLRSSPKPEGFLDQTNAVSLWIYELSTKFVNILRKIQTLLDLKLGYVHQDNFFILEEPVYLNVFGVGGFSEPCLECEPVRI